MGERKFSPWVHTINWRCRIDKEAVAALRSGGPPMSISAQPLQPLGSPTFSDDRLDTQMRLTRYLGDPKVRQALRSVKRRVRDIDTGTSPKLSFPMSRSIGHMPNDSRHSKHDRRRVILSAAAPLLTAGEVQELDQFITTRLLPGSRSMTPAGVRPRRQVADVSLLTKPRPVSVQDRRY